MNNRLYIVAAALCILAVSCGIKEQEEAIPSFGGYEEFYATIEQPAETDTKTFTDNDLHVLWHEDDRVTIFNKFSYNQEFAFTGETGDNSGGFSKVAGDEFVTGFDLANVYSVYPFQKSTKIDSDGKMTITLPAEQAWAERSFSRGANTMIAATADNKLKFKNIGGLLVLKLYGAGVQVSSVSLKGNAGELIAGKASVTMPIDGLPEVEMQEGAADAISLLCETPVALGASEADYTEFWLVIPPTDFTRGFTITVTGAGGGTFVKSTDKSISIARNHISRMAPIEVSLEKPATEPEWVDLGLSVKWATFNVGATKPEEYGDYFAWGETEPYYEEGYAYSDNPVWKVGKESGYNYPSYKWYNYDPDSDSDGYSKYCPLNTYDLWFGTGSPDNKSVLDLEDDTAAVNWGDCWRMPTIEEWMELKDNCNWIWTSDYNGTGVSGHMVISTIPGYTDRSIFLPAARDRVMTSPSTSEIYYLRYWSSSRSVRAGTAHDFYGFSNRVEASGNTVRCIGMPIRPVYGVFIPVSSITIDENSITLEPGTTAQLSVSILPLDATAQNVYWRSSDYSVATVNQEGTEGIVRGVSPGVATISVYASNGLSAECEVVVKEETDTNGYEYVDLGLSVKWATFNVGATKPEEYGDYFAWGETDPKKDYEWETYKWCADGHYTMLTKYNTTSSYGIVDNKTVLDPEDDAAHVNWGETWRMPLEAEWTELRENCTWTWTGNYNGTGVAGRIVTSNMPGYTNKSIFLPAPGYRDYSSFNTEGSRGYYWSSSLNWDTAWSAYYASDNCAWCVIFDSNNVVSYYEILRCRGLSIRPVYGKFVPVSSISLNKTSLELSVRDTYQLTATVSPANATAKDVNWRSSDTSIASVDRNGLVTAHAVGTATITAYGSRGARASCVVTIQYEASANGYEYVDLGLPSGLRWAKINVGATKPEEYGDCFAWGETEPKEVYSPESYKFGAGQFGPFSKYVTNSSSGTVDNKNVLDPEDDVAHVKWGGGWRMPTDAEWKELKNNCTWRWISNYNGTGVAGIAGTSKISGYTDKSIFLPAPARDSYTYSYWSSSLSSVDYTACSFGDKYSSSYRYMGLPVRPVHEVPVSSISLDKTSLELSVGDTYQLTATISPKNATAKDVRWASSDKSVVTVDSNGLVTANWSGAATITAYGSSGVSATCEVTVRSRPVSPQAVDLGLPSGVKWATFNVGATKPEEYGEYFAWGETDPKEDYGSGLYKWYNYNSYGEGKLTKYNNFSSDYGVVDNKAVLDPEDDTAYVNWGSSWRMPTDAEWTELRENCTWTWTNNYNGTGVAGRIVTSNMPGYTNRSIFLPAAGYRQDTYYYYAGSRGFYWSSSLGSSFVPWTAWAVYFNYGTVERIDDYDRPFGFSVRPVTK